MSNHDQQPDQPRAVPDRPIEGHVALQGGYQPRPQYEGYQPKAKAEDIASPSRPPENPPNQGPVGRKR